MKRTLIALALALGATAAVAEPTLELKRAGRVRLEATRRKRPRTRPAASSSTTTRPATPSTRNLASRTERSNTMKHTLIALALALGATAAVAEPTLNLQSAQNESVWKNAPERPPTRPAASSSTTTPPTTPSTRNATHGSAGAGNGPGAAKVVTTMEPVSSSTSSAS